MERSASEPTSPGSTHPVAGETLMPVLVALSVCHLLNDIIQALLPSIFPLLKDSFGLTFTQIGWIGFVFQCTASLLQPVVGHYTDRRPKPYSLPIGMGITLIGLVVLSRAPNFGTVLAGAALLGTGSSIFHPEASRLARLASGGKHGFAQALFQVGGNLGTSLGPLAAAFVVAPRGHAHLLWFSVLAVLGIGILARVGGWYRRHLTAQRASAASVKRPAASYLSSRQIAWALVVLGALIFSKYFYLTSLTSYYTFYLIAKFEVSVQHAQLYLFLFLFAVAAGTILGGPIGDRYGRKLVIWISILGVTPFSLVLPHVGLAATAVLSVIIGLILASAFSAILVYAQELMPGKVGLVAGLFFGFAFGMAGIASALLGKLADLTSIFFVFQVCSFLALIGLLTVFLPDVEGRAKH
jgi:MFS transporter, FSR family, fosmidomycin resistance protein